MAKASRYEAPFEFLREHVYPVRRDHREPCQRHYWWLHARPSPRYRVALKHFRAMSQAHVYRSIVFSFGWPQWNSSTHVVVFCSPESWFFGVMQSSLHEVWALRLRHGLKPARATRQPPALRRSRSLSQMPGTGRHCHCSARSWTTCATRWLNPPEWTKTEVLEFPGSVDGPWGRYVVEPNARGIGTVRWPRTVPKDADCAASLGKRTLTNLYNQRPAWLDLGPQETRRGRAGRLRLGKRHIRRRSVGKAPGAEPPARGSGDL